MLANEMCILKEYDAAYAIKMCGGVRLYTIGMAEGRRLPQPEVFQLFANTRTTTTLAASYRSPF